MNMDSGVEVRNVRDSGAHASARLPVVSVLAAAGIVGPIVFTVAFILQGLFRPSYSHMAEPISALGTGPNGTGFEPCTLRLTDRFAAFRNRGSNSLSTAECHQLAPFHTGVAVRDGCLSLHRRTRK
jgi:hypothetical protein